MNLLGNIAASRDTSSTQRIFFTVHPESRPTGHKVYEIRDHQAIPFPSAEDQSLFNTVLGMYIDNQQRLWTIDHGNHGTDPVKLLAFDLQTNQLVHEHTFTSEVAELGSFFNDLCVSPDGRYVFIADVSFWRKKPSLVVYDVEQNTARSCLDGHISVTSQRFVPITPLKKMRFFGGLADLMPGIDGIDIDWQGEYVYYAAMSHESLFRIPVAVLTNFSLSEEEINKAVEWVSEKPLSDGIRLDVHGNIYITDVENRGFALFTPNGSIKTLIEDQRIRWADGATIAADGYCYFTDSAIPDMMLMPKAHMEEKKPYFIFRFKTKEDFEVKEIELPLSPNE
jgi:sugar lactone lactonase YvrE